MFIVPAMTSSSVTVAGAASWARTFEINDKDDTAIAPTSNHDESLVERDIKFSSREFSSENVMRCKPAISAHLLRALAFRHNRVSKSFDRANTTCVRICGEKWNGWTQLSGSAFPVAPQLADQRPFP